MPCRALARFSTHDGLQGTGRIRVIGSRGAFIVTGAELTAGTPLSLLVLGNESARHVVEVAATVVNTEPYGIEVQWSERLSRAICSRVGCAIPCCEEAT